MHELSSRQNRTAEYVPQAEARSFRGGEGVYESLPSLQDIRTAFVDKMDWPLDEGSIDIDRYDADPRTTEFYCEDEAGDALITMRLTKIDQLGDMMSLEMLDSRPDMQEAAWRALTDLRLERPETKLYDLTRLIPRDDVRGLLAATLMLEMFVLAMEQTAPRDKERSQDVVWAFAVTNGMRRALDRIGIQSTVITSGWVSDKDKQTTDFCYIRPYEATTKALQSSLSTDELARRAILRGHVEQKSL